MLPAGNRQDEQDHGPTSCPPFDLPSSRRSWGYHELNLQPFAPFFFTCGPNTRYRDVHIGIDIKRIEARQDIHKRCDEIVNKAAKLKAVFRKAKFGAVIYSIYSRSFQRHQPP
jgi:hypothetical protein